MALNKYNKTFLAVYVQIVLYKKLYKKAHIFQFTIYYFTVDIYYE